jgi:hypothetical protein
MRHGLPQRAGPCKDTSSRDCEFVDGLTEAEARAATAYKAVLTRTESA